MNKKLNYWLAPVIMSNQKIGKARINATVDLICETFGVTKLDLISRSRKQELSEARNIIYYVLHKVYKLTACEVARMFHRNHATILNGANRIEGFMEVDKNYRKQISKLLN